MMSMVVSLLWFTMPVFLTMLWISMISAFAYFSILTCGKKPGPPQPQATTPQQTTGPSGGTGTGTQEKKPEPSEGEKKSSVKFTASQQAKIDAELKAALEAEKQAKEAKEAKGAKKEEKTGPAPAVTMAKGIDGPPPQSLQKPISLGMTKVADVGKGGGAMTKYEPAKREVKDGKDSKDKKEEPKKSEAKKDEAGTKKKDEPKKDDAKKDTAAPQKKDESKKEKKEEKPAGGKDEKKVDPKNDAPGAPLGPGKPPPKPAVVDDGRSRYVGENPANLLMSAYVKPMPKK